MIIGSARITSYRSTTGMGPDGQRTYGSELVSQSSTARLPICIVHDPSRREREEATASDAPISRVVEVLLAELDAIAAEPAPGDRLDVREAGKPSSEMLTVAEVTSPFARASGAAMIVKLMCQRRAGA